MIPAGHGLPNEGCLHSAYQSRASARDLERTFDYEDCPLTQYDLEEHDLSNRIQEVRQQNALLQSMCSLVLQKSRAAHDENLALLHLIEMLNIVKGCITLNRNSLPVSAAAEPTVPAAPFRRPAAQPSSRQPARAQAPPASTSSGALAAYQGPPSPTLIAPQLTSHDSIVADAEQDPSCLSPAGKHKHRPAVPTASQLLSARQLLDAHQQRASQQRSSAAQALFPGLSQGLLGVTLPQHRQQGGPQPPPHRSHSHHQPPAACHGMDLSLEDAPYSTADIKSLEAVAAAALAHNECHVGGAIIDLLLLGARRRTNHAAS